MKRSEIEEQPLHDAIYNCRSRITPGFKHAGVHPGYENWSGFQDKMPWKSAPLLIYKLGELLLTSKIRHSSVGWNPVHRIFKHLDGLGLSLRWDDGVIRSSPRDGRNLCKFSLTCCLEKFGKYRADITKLISAGALPITVLRVSIRHSAWRKGVTA